MTRNTLYIAIGCVLIPIWPWVCIAALACLVVLLIGAMAYGMGKAAVMLAGYCWSRLSTPTEER